MTNFEIRVTTDLLRPSVVGARGNGYALFTGDNRAHSIVLNVLRGGEPANLSGCTAYCYAQGAEGKYQMSGVTISGNTVTAPIAQSVYSNLSGMVTFVVKIVKSSENVEMTAAVIVGVVDKVLQDGAPLVPVAEAWSDAKIQSWISQLESEINDLTNNPQYKDLTGLREELSEISDQFDKGKKDVPSKDITVHDNKYWNPTDGVRLSDASERIAYEVNVSPKTNYDIAGKYVGVVSGYDVWFFDNNGGVIEKINNYEQITVDGEAYHTLVTSPDGASIMRYSRNKTSDINGLKKDVTSKVKGLAEVEERVSVTEKDIEVLKRASATESVNGLNLIRNNIPSYYKEASDNPLSYNDYAYIDSKIDSIPDGKSYVFITDTHWDWDTNAQNSINLIEYINGRKGIKNVVFGGDFINAQDNKYLASQVLQDFAIKCKNAFGNGFLPIIGNHDTNMAGYNSSQGTVENKYLPFHITQNAMMNLVPTFETEWDFVKDKVRDFTTDEAKIKDIEGYFKWCYTYDDDVNHVHHIMLNGGNPNYGTIADVFGSDDIRLHLEWFHRALMQTKEGYDVSVGIHTIHKPHTMTLTAIDVKMYVLMAMGLKTKSNKQTYIGKSSDVLYRWYPFTSKTYDFRNANNVGKVYFIAGHSHCDGISVIGQNPASGEFNAYTIKEYTDGYTVNQTTVTPNNGCEIPIIWTTTDAHGRAEDWSKGGGDSSYEVSMEKGTITEQAFDVVTIVNDGINLTRIGAGNDRFVRIDA